METITQKLNELKLTVTKSDKVAAYSEPQVGCPSKVEELTELLKHMGNQSIMHHWSRTTSTRDTYH